MRKGHGAIPRLPIGLAAAIAVMLMALGGPAYAAEPLKIGFGMALTGGLADTGKAALLATKMWAEEHEATFETLVEAVKFGPTGEQAVPRILFVQYQGIAGNDIEQFNQPGKQVIVSPPAFASGKFLYPYADLRR